jgi:CelD/BcsL family acetyltransferase involved in cellulose biosynthesis
VGFLLTRFPYFSYSPNLIRPPEDSLCAVPSQGVFNLDCTHQGPQMKSAFSVHGITLPGFEQLVSYWRSSGSPLKWECIFVSPPWLQSWWRTFDPQAKLNLYALKQGGDLVGFAPLLLKGEKAAFIGSEEVCDFLDFVVAPGIEYDFFSSLLRDLEQKGVKSLDLRLVRPGSTVLNHLLDIATEKGYATSCQVEDVSLELELPGTWPEYLAGLSRKQRHEVRRKIRKLEKAGDVNYRALRDPQAVLENLDIFFDLFRKSSPAKEQFLSVRKGSFFRTMAKALAQEDLLGIGLLDYRAETVGAVLYFDYNQCIYLYNSGYDPGYGALSVGLVCKLLCIKNAIAKGKQRFDFLKGAEAYKYRLGGREVPLYGCRIGLRQD